MNKIELTEKFLSQLGLPTDAKTIRKYKSEWWANPRSKNNGLRLTDYGFKVLTERLELTSYNVVFPPETEFNSELILRLDKFLETPYYIARKSIVVFREKTALELILFGGDIQKYGWAKAKSQQKTLDNEA